MVTIYRWLYWYYSDSCLNTDDMLKSLSVPEPIKSLLEREFGRWESIIIEGVRESLLDIKSSFGESLIWNSSTWFIENWSSVLCSKEKTLENACQICILMSYFQSSLKLKRWKCPWPLLWSGYRTVIMFITLLIKYKIHNRGSGRRDWRHTVKYIYNYTFS